MGKTTDDILAKIGCKNTKSRKAVIEVLENAENPLSAEDIFLCIKKQGSSVNLSTVYRTLDLMESKSVVNKIVMMDGKARYELTVDGHRHHLVCTNCHKSVPIDFCPLENMEKDIGMRSDFDITGHKIEIYGICPNCKKE
ncbi:MAG TPA: transcriptional repressor [Hungateiclostridium thermocellum]|jgi:Fur family ferric uptake transcriptional regulator|uniref:Ferric uptake regulator, Fur family n=2 Tax=Acetivibrio thermocellus TaxID=1515 RepID=A3DCV3_ACET2|nr:transcriptional repressor [Acetivibrio thermocellus]CDG35239.1 ferric uptake regulator family protein [Acetivibrio thermocellus BC1]ABN51782.1 ferric uptake regulator, Fur family [Acetivibrio thermocellus ATCC 27405]ADU74748.1 ferric uptake regulator, Fur family [Acetivibrio thermocellus DSM 1313]ALX08699.1 ferric uptake regulator, Fur family [Acetivibrio thermocellus AD2]ANV76451.1 ferric uptake regulator, Fur family [Acetivibrio thermocellus DSM 2360]